MSITMNPAGREWLDKQFKPDVPQCSFLDMACVRPEYGHLCGGFTPEYMNAKSKQAAINTLPTPCWFVKSTTARIIIPDQQLSLFDPPIVLYDHHDMPIGFPKIRPQRHWHTAPYFCKIGRDWAIGIERKLGARHIRVEEIRRKPGCKVKNTSIEFTDFCI
mgnify:CR=1 FL=1